MYTQLLDFIEHNQIVYVHQYCFRPKHSTQQSMITATDYTWQSHDNNRKYTSILKRILQNNRPLWIIINKYHIFIKTLIAILHTT